MSEKYVNEVPLRSRLETRIASFFENRLPDAERDGMRKVSTDDANAFGGLRFRLDDSITKTHDILMKLADYLYGGTKGMADRALLDAIHDRWMDDVVFSGDYLRPFADANSLEDARRVAEAEIIHILTETIRKAVEPYFEERRQQVHKKVNDGQWLLDALANKVQTSDEDQSSKDQFVRETYEDTLDVSKHICRRMKEPSVQQRAEAEVDLAKEKRCRDSERRWYRRQLEKIRRFLQEHVTGQRGEIAIAMMRDEATFRDVDSIAAITHAPRKSVSTERSYIHYQIILKRFHYRRIETRRMAVVPKPELT